MTDELEPAIARIAADSEHGARWLARAAAEAMALACRTPDASGSIGAIRDVARRLASARPSMAALANTVASIWSVGRAEASEQDLPTRLRRMQYEARRLSRYWDEVDQRLIQHATPLLNGPIYTLSRSGTVEAALLAFAPTRGEARRVVVAESRPGGEGVGLAKALAAGGWGVTLVADAACGLFVPTVDAVLIGADSVRSNGAVVNKVGSYPLALMARAHDKPFYVVCESLKIAPPELPLTLERLPAGPVVDGMASAIPLDNLAFDVTPPELITAVVTERGSLNTRDISRLADEATRAYQDLFGDGATTQGG